MNNLQTYENVLVSSTAHDFKGRRHGDVPRALLAEWVTLIASIARVIHPAFTVRPLTDADQFKSETISSDGPYPSSENHYYLSFMFLDLIDTNGVGIRISYEAGRQEGGEPLFVETQGVQPKITSFIEKDARSPRARIYVFHDTDKAAEIRALIAAHTAACGG